MVLKAKQRELQLTMNEIQSTEGEVFLFKNQVENLIFSFFHFKKMQLKVLFLKQ